MPYGSAPLSSPWERAISTDVHPFTLTLSYFLLICYFSPNDPHWLLAHLPRYSHILEVSLHNGWVWQTNVLQIPPCAPWFHSFTMHDMPTPEVFIWKQIALITMCMWDLQLQERQLLAWYIVFPCPFELHDTPTIPHIPFSGTNHSYIHIFANDVNPWPMTLAFHLLFYYLHFSAGIELNPINVLHTLLLMYQDCRQKVYVLLCGHASAKHFVCIHDIATCVLYHSFAP